MSISIREGERSTTPSARGRRRATIVRWLGAMPPGERLTQSGWRRSRPETYGWSTPMPSHRMGSRLVLGLSPLVRRRRQLIRESSCRRARSLHTGLSRERQFSRVDQTAVAAWRSVTGSCGTRSNTPGPSARHDSEPAAADLGSSERMWRSRGGCSTWSLTPGGEVGALRVARIADHVSVASA